jgi:hypothetical protein
VSSGLHPPMLNSLGPWPLPESTGRHEILWPSVAHLPWTRPLWSSGRSVPSKFLRRRGRIGSQGPSCAADSKLIAAVSTKHRLTTPMAVTGVLELGRCGTKPLVQRGSSTVEWSSVCKYPVLSNTIYLCLVARGNSYIDFHSIRSRLNTLLTSILELVILDNTYLHKLIDREHTHKKKSPPLALVETWGIHWNIEVTTCNTI